MTAGIKQRTCDELSGILRERTTRTGASASVYYNAHDNKAHRYLTTFMVPRERGETLKLTTALVDEQREIVKALREGGWAVAPIESAKDRHGQYLHFEVIEVTRYSEERAS